MKRTEQIKLLKGLLSGAKTVNDLVLQKPRIFTKRDNDDFYREIAGKLFYEKDEPDLKKIFTKDPILIINITRTIIKKGDINHGLNHS